MGRVGTPAAESAVRNVRAQRRRRWARAAAIAITALAVVAVAFAISGVVDVITYNAPSTCGGQPCTATGASVFLPNSDRIDIQLRGPGPGIDYAPAGSPSNVVER